MAVLLPSLLLGPLRHLLRYWAFHVKPLRHPQQPLPHLSNLGKLIVAMKLKRVVLVMTLHPTVSSNGAQIIAIQHARERQRRFTSGYVRVVGIGAWGALTKKL